VQGTFDRKEDALMPTGNRNELANYPIARLTKLMISIHCRCGATGRISPDGIAAQRGPDTMLLDVLDRAKCQRCGDRGQYDIRIVPLPVGDHRP